ncbi:MAG TPA: M15 family metallopeptidase, partial [Myxococcaceae bacterium]|nr:M15 family metallopeptidase [Myxococcaceae bacterium]
MRAALPVLLLVVAFGAGAQSSTPTPVPPASRPVSPQPPPGLACLPKHYPVKPVLKDGVWCMELPDGSVVPYDDGRPKTFDEMVESPDMQDTYIIPYRTGTIVPVIDENDDPGHFRYLPLFQATYGASEREVDLVRVSFLGMGYRVHRRAKPAFERVVERLRKARAANPRIGPFLEEIGGTYHWRKIADTERMSAHSFGVAIDLNPQRSHYWDWIRPNRPVFWKNSIPQAIVDAFEAEGFIWGGRWYHYDTMHFEYRPELLDPDCRPR